MIVRHLACAMVLGACILGSAACARQPVSSPSVQVAAPLDTATAEGTPRWMYWATTMPGVSLDEAREEVGVPIRLPDASVAGAITKVVLDDTASFESGHPGLLIMFGSGVTLSIQHRPYDLVDVGSQVASFTDGRPRAFQSRTVDGASVLAGEAGTQTTMHGDNAVPSQLMWNEGQIGYRLTGPSADFGVERLVEVMRTRR